MLPPELMCHQHIVGEHGEIHKFRHSFIKHHSMNKRMELNQIFPQLMKFRHDKLSGYLKKHQSPYEQPSISYLPNNGIVNLNMKILIYNVKDLSQRCPDCRKIMEGFLINSTHCMYISNDQYIKMN